MESSLLDSSQIRQWIEKCLRAALPPETPLPAVDEDWIETELLDSMSHVEVLVAIESAFDSPDLFAHIGDAPPTTIRSATDLIVKALSQQSG